MNKNKVYKEYIDSFRSPENDIDRTYYQYKCINFPENRTKYKIRNLISYPMLIVISFFYLINRIILRKRQSVDAVFINSADRRDGKYSYDGIFPEILNNEFKEIKTVEFSKYPSLKTGVLTNGAFRFWLAIVKKYPAEGWMNMMCFIHIMSINRITLLYSPKAVINYRLEFNFTSSVVANYLEKQGIELINFMHGDYVVDKRRAFVRFSRCYIFDRHYIDVFKWSRSPIEQFRVYTPSIYLTVLPKTEIHYYLGYYFSDEEGDIQGIKDILSKLVSMGLKCKVRPHPRYSNVELIEKTFLNSGIVVEKSSEVSINDSIAETSYIAGRRSTVLNEAHAFGKTIVIDDISIPEIYENMKEDMNILVSSEHIKLSDIITVSRCSIN